MLRVIYLFILVFIGLGWSSDAISVVNSNAMFLEESNEIRSSVALQPNFLEQKVDSNYIIGPGDFFDIFLEDHNVTVQVSPSSKVVIEGAGIIDVSDMPLYQAKQAILELATKKYDREYCYVYLSKLKFFRVGIYGAVRIPGQHAMQGGMRLSSLLMQVGGTLSYSDDRNVKLIRNGDTTIVSCYKYEYAGDVTNDPHLQQGDIIFIPFVDMSKPRVNVQWKAGENVESVYLEWEKGSTVLDYIQRSGAMRIYNVAFKNINISKFDNPELVSYPFSMASSIVLDSNTIVDLTVRKSYVYVGGAAAAPGRVEFNASFTPMDYVASAGVLTISKRLNRLDVIRSSGETVTLDVSTGIIYPGDYIKLPKSNYEITKDFVFFMTSLLAIVSSALTIYLTVNPRQLN